MIKFITSDERTRDLLAQWSPNSKVIVVTFYLWLSGSKIQRSLKGFLYSMLRQIISNDTSLFNKIILEDSTILVKHQPDDWSVGELKRLLRKSIALTANSLCIFVDGLDEFDQDDSVDSLIDIVEDLSAYAKVKVCVSSRPENYLVKRFFPHRQIKLQGLTAEDIEICIRDGLKNARLQCRQAQFTEERFEEVVKSMKHKSDGVFLWVHYALSSLIRGVRNEDDFNDLLSRIDELPSGMQQLYLQMWQRLNGDEQRYRDEAAIYFSYSEQFLHQNNYSPSLFELLVALDEPLQNDYVSFMEPQHPVNLVEGCQKLSNSIITRCAGLLEFHKYKRCIGKIVVRDSDSNHSQDMLDATSINGYGDTYIKYIHRTAADFLRSTKEGIEIKGKTKISAHSRYQNVFRAKLAALIPKLIDFDSHFVSYMIHSVAESNSPNEIDLMTTLKRVCMKLSTLGSPTESITHRGFWESSQGFYFDGFQDFEGEAISAGCYDYVCHLVENEHAYLSPYYLGYLFLCETKRWPAFSSFRGLSLLSLLVSRGADVMTKHSSLNHCFAPAAE